MKSLLRKQKESNQQMITLRYISFPCIGSGGFIDGTISHPNLFELPIYGQSCQETERETEANGLNWSSTAELLRPRQFLRLATHGPKTPCFLLLVTAYAVDAIVPRRSGSKFHVEKEIHA